MGKETRNGSGGEDFHPTGYSPHSARSEAVHRWEPDFWVNPAMEKVLSDRGLSFNPQALVGLLSARSKETSQNQLAIELGVGVSTIKNWFELCGIPTGSQIAAEEPVSARPKPTRRKPPMVSEPIPHRGKEYAERVLGGDPKLMLELYYNSMNITIVETARRLGVSLKTLERWNRRFDVEIEKKQRAIGMQGWRKIVDDLSMDRWDKLKEREKEVFCLRFHRNWTLEEIGVRFGVSKEMVRGIVTRAVNKLQGKPRKKRETRIVK